MRCWSRSVRVFLFVVIVTSGLFPSRGRAVNYTVSGTMRSRIRYEMRQDISAGGGVLTMELRLVMPLPFDAPTYRQTVDGVDLTITPSPAKKREYTDRRGNKVVVVSWNHPAKVTEARLDFTATTQTKLTALNTHAGFPMAPAPAKAADYLKPTALVQSGDPAIQQQSRELIQGVKTEFDAVQRILSWVVDHMKYINPPKQYDALYSLKTGRGNCQNFSHLAAALMRAAGIPVRIVNGITLNRPFSVQRKTGELTFKMGQGRHSWIEVWFPDLAWVPFDPQQTEMFIPNRYLRFEIGADNKETINDGLLRWTRPAKTPAAPRMEETISATFLDDNIAVRGIREPYGPRNLLLCPQVEAAFKTIRTPPPKAPKPMTPEMLKTLSFPVPFLFGNLSYPMDVDFAFPRQPERGDKGQLQLARNFLVETAEYVTSRATQYAQAFVLQKPIRLEKIGLALHNFGGDGMLWVELRKDAGSRPGEVISTSDLLPLSRLSSRPGYRWVDFDFSRDTPVLSPGTYWMALGFTGSPIVNWFYTYGKPVGPAEGTRYKGVFDPAWSNALNFEFNYRIIGHTIR